jgi:putative oxidoreductase
VNEFDLALLVLRVAVGLTMAAHGYNKVRGGLDGVASWFEGIGMRPGALHARFAAYGEILAGLFLAAGLLTSFAALGFVGLMVVAGYTVHLENGFFILDEGWEYVMVLAVVAAVIATLGPGEWSFDHLLGIADDLDGYLGLAISAGGGLAAAIGLLAVFYRPPDPEPEVDQNTV